VNWTQVTNDGGGNCLIHALVQAKAVSIGAQAPAGASASEIQQLRGVIATSLDADYIISLCAAAIVARVERTPEPGLGPAMQSLLSTVNFGAIRETRATKTRQAREMRGAATAMDTSGSQPATVRQGPLIMPQLGMGVPLDNVAILHTGGVHYVMLQRVQTPVPKDVEMAIVT